MAKDNDKKGRLTGNNVVVRKAYKHGEEYFEATIGKHSPLNSSWNYFLRTECYLVPRETQCQFGAQLHAVSNSRQETLNQQVLHTQLHKVSAPCIHAHAIHCSPMEQL